MHAPRSRNVKVKAGSKIVGIYGKPGGILRAVYLLSLLVPVAARLTSSLHWIVSKGQAIDGHMIYLDGNGAPTGFHPFWRDPSMIVCSTWMAMGSAFIRSGATPEPSGSS